MKHSLLTPIKPVLGTHFFKSSIQILRVYVCDMPAYVCRSVSACASGSVFLWLRFGEVRCIMGEALAAPLSGGCQPVYLCTLPFFGPTLPFKHLSTFAALTYPVKTLLPLRQWAGLTVLLTLQLQGSLHCYVTPFLIALSNIPNTFTQHDKFNIQVMEFAMKGFFHGTGLENVSL